VRQDDEIGLAGCSVCPVRHAAVKWDPFTAFAFGEYLIVQLRLMLDRWCGGAVAIPAACFTPG
jgi:hypothetical protein